MRKIFICLLLSAPVYAQKFTDVEIKRWADQVKQVTITRDTYGVPHIYGKTDADAVFGMLYAQCEDDFPRVERNYLTATARRAEADGEDYIYQDLRMRLFMDTTRAIAIYKTMPDGMKKLCQAFADGANFYLYSHPETKPKLIRRFQPWMPLLFSEGSIGGDIEEISLVELKKFYGKLPVEVKSEAGKDGDDPGGSNGFAIAPSKSATGNALLYINPHVTFYFRSEQQVTSDEGLNAYGAVTWGQFFIYQGFNEHCGWMHTSSDADVIDWYEETITKKGDTWFSKYGTSQKKVTVKKIVITYKSKTGVSKKEFTTFATVHGPVVAETDEKWISAKLMQEPLKALTQSFSRTKAKTFEEFKKVMDLRTNSSNNTVYADDQKNIAYWHGNFMPIRDPAFDWNIRVDGSNPATEWKGLHTVDQVIHVYNPESGWIQNCNSTPFTASGTSSPKKESYPAYMAPDAENARGIHAVKVLSEESSFTLDKLIAAGFDSYLPAFKDLVPSYIQAFDLESISNDTLRSRYIEPIALLRKWDLRYSNESVATTIAICWSTKLQNKLRDQITPGMPQWKIINMLNNATQQQKIISLAQTMTELNRHFGTWKLPWGELNRFQRLTGNIDASFDDDKNSMAIPFTSSFWGSLASFVSRRYPNTKKMYGYNGNSFIAAVEFGKKVKAKSIVTGGSSSDPASAHFNDQADGFAQGRFKDVWFYPEDLAAHIEKKYHPGDK